MIETGEQCDDDNTRPGDGCNGVCQREPNYLCPTAGAPCVYAPNSVCGNGVVEPGEQCDDGTDAGGRGCSPQCAIETGFTCPADGGMCLPDAVCGDGKVTAIRGEQCDDGTNDGLHGCSAGCQVVTGWKRPPPAAPACSTCTAATASRTPASSATTRTAGASTGARRPVSSSWGGSAPRPRACVRVCGNGVVDMGETCDDGDVFSGDGCSSKCLTEPNFTCSMPGKPCVFTPPPPPPRCGNGVVETPESCDDGNAGWWRRLFGGLPARERGGDARRPTCRASRAGAATASSPAPSGATTGSSTAYTAAARRARLFRTRCVLRTAARASRWSAGTAESPAPKGATTASTTGGTAARRPVIAPGWICPLAGTPCVPVCGDGLVVGTSNATSKATSRAARPPPAS